MKPHIAVIGDLMIDHYLWGKSDRISPEAPVPVIEIEKETSTLGGAGNVVSNLISLGADVTVFSVVGDDEIANQLVKLLENIGAKHFLVMDEKRKTSKKSRIIASHQQVIRYDKESKTPIDTKHEKELIKALFTSVHTFDLILISDYNKGVVTKSLIEKINFAALGTNLKVLADPKGSDFGKYLGCYLLTPNKKEASLATNIDIVDDDSLYQALKKLHNIAALQIPLITLSEDGIAFLDENSNLIKKPTVAKEVFDVTGAGDTVLAALGIMLAQNKNINDAVSFANLAAGVVVGKIGSATVNMQEIEEYKLSLHQSSVENKIQSFNKISNNIESSPLIHSIGISKLIGALGLFFHSLP
jgi:D-beta-D-heptose 7-phosphate kinase/D-beta-D-heptose 1-phosphate adenosyltransferase